MYCTSCSAVIEKNTSFCNMCGAPVVEVASSILSGFHVDTVHCRTCSKELFMDSKVCSKCGTPTDKTDKLLAKSETFLHNYKLWTTIIVVVFLGIGYLVANFGGNLEVGVLIMVVGAAIGLITAIVGFIVSATTFTGSIANEVSKSAKKRKDRGG